MPVQPMVVEEREAPYIVPVNPKKKPRMLELGDVYRPKQQPPLPGPYIPPSMPKLPPRFALEDVPIRVKHGAAVTERTPRTRKRPVEDAPDEAARSRSTRRRGGARVRVVAP
jgi:hypothetical protein